METLSIYQTSKLEKLLSIVMKIAQPLAPTLLLICAFMSACAGVKVIECLSWFPYGIFFIFISVAFIWSSVFFLNLMEEI